MATLFLAQFVPSQAAQGWHTAQAAACERDGRVIVGVLIDMPSQYHTKGQMSPDPRQRREKKKEKTRVARRND